ncbi:mediator complex subunit Med9 [Schizosaccharomyces octosporus yFS286]|uniref:Mediator complex subunit Med9 n=1 Tax=Schizosaccharomyces octosporus (strain yFS286) TaxID=483514 RepID=S9PU04_SCHOY|nr:mediator complex subunit Med9 [Schizosaccharomyces octosporus yFS286]EPX70973.1 mediator complex subunit Med9 [Schizosaccharomyces octosporus yFS286]
MGDARELLQRIKQERTGVKRTRSESNQDNKKQKALRNDDNTKHSEDDFIPDRSSQARLNSSNDEMASGDRNKTSLPDDFFDESVPKNENLINEEWSFFQNEINDIEQQATQKESLLQEKELQKQSEASDLNEKEISNSRTLSDETDINLRPDDYDALYLDDSNRDYREKLSLIKESFQNRQQESSKPATNVSDEESEGSVIDDNSLWGFQENS